VIEAGLLAIVALVLVLPITVHAVERNLELFLFVMGVLSVSIAHFGGGEPVWTAGLIAEALREPLPITAAVAVAGLIVYFSRQRMTAAIVAVERALGWRLFSFFLITVLGLVASGITAIMAAIILVEVVSALQLDRRCETRLVILGCFSIGLGAALTPIGEPLSTICIAKLRGEPYHAGFFFLLKNLGAYIIPGIIALGLFGAAAGPSAREDAGAESLAEKENESLRDIALYAGKVYLFITALILLGTGFKPVVDAYIVRLPGPALFWINALSAVMDNATLTAAEVSPRMTLGQLQYILVGLLAAGGMLIPGNIPNIIAANRLSISSTEWAKTGVPLGLGLMAVYFLVFAVLV
jgi:predicted cation transporter